MNEGPAGGRSPSIRLQDDRRSGPLSQVPADALIQWCKQNPDRWSRVAPHIWPFARGFDEEGEAGRISPLAFAFLKAAPRPEEVVEAYCQHIAPMIWSDSRANIMERRLGAIKSLQDDLELMVGDTISRLSSGIQAIIDRMRQAEHEEERERDQRFE